MKRCPKCHSHYSDVTLRFCLQDGTPLAEEIKQSAIDTVAFFQPVTTRKIVETQNFIDVAPPERRPEPVPAYSSAPVPDSPKRGVNGWMYGVLSVLVLMVVGAGGIFGWLYLSTPNKADQRPNFERQEPVTTAPMNVSRTSDVVTNDKPLSPRPISSPGKVDADAIRREVAADIDSWKQSAETCNATDYAAKYGEKVEYHDRHGVAAQEIRHEAEKTCSTYSKVEIKVDNMVVAVDAEGDAATAIFDKEWRYEASPKLAQGKVHLKLHFRKVTDGWKIVSEQNLKTYYSKS